jgi:hypothetical protein
LTEVILGILLARIATDERLRHQHSERDSRLGADATISQTRVYRFQEAVDIGDTRETGLQEVILSCSPLDNGRAENDDNKAGPGADRDGFSEYDPSENTTDNGKYRDINTEEARKVPLNRIDYNPVSPKYRTTHENDGKGVSTQPLSYNCIPSYFQQCSTNENNPSNKTHFYTRSLFVSSRVYSVFADSQTHHALGDSQKSRGTGHVTTGAP